MFGILSLKCDILIVGKQLTQNNSKILSIYFLFASSDLSCFANGHQVMKLTSPMRKTLMVGPLM